MRFKTASELVIDELREAATVILEGSDSKLVKGVDDAMVDDNVILSKKIGNLIPNMDLVGTQLESAGERIMKRDSMENIGECLVIGGEGLYALALGIQMLGDDDNDNKENKESMEVAKLSGARMLYAAEKMKEAGNNIKGIQPEKKKGKSWLKG